MTDQNDCNSWFKAPALSDGAILLDPNDPSQELDIENSDPETLFAAATDGWDLNPEHRDRVQAAIIPIITTDEGWSRFARWFERQFVVADDYIHANLIINTLPPMIFHHSVPDATVLGVVDRDNLARGCHANLIDPVAYTTTPTVRRDDLAKRPVYLLSRLVQRTRNSIERQMLYQIVKLLDRIATPSRRLCYAHATRFGDPYGTVLCHHKRMRFALENTFATPIRTSMCPCNTIFVMPEGRGSGCFQITGGSVEPDVSPEKLSLSIAINAKLMVREDANIGKYEVE